jgi:hypothetical protein
MVKMLSVKYKIGRCTYKPLWYKNSFVCYEGLLSYIHKRLAKPTLWYKNMFTFPERADWVFGQYSNRDKMKGTDGLVFENHLRNGTTEGHVKERI